MIGLVPYPRILPRGKAFIIERRQQLGCEIRERRGLAPSIILIIDQILNPLLAWSFQGADISGVGRY